MSDDDKYGNSDGDRRSRSTPSTGDSGKKKQRSRRHEQPSQQPQDADEEDNPNNTNSWAIKEAKRSHPVTTAPTDDAASKLKSAWASKEAKRPHPLGEPNPQSKRVSWISKEAKRPHPVGLVTWTRRENEGPQSPSSAESPAKRVSWATKENKRPHPTLGSNCILTTNEVLPGLTESVEHQNPDADVLLERTALRGSPDAMATNLDDDEEIVVPRTPRSEIEAEPPSDSYQGGTLAESLVEARLVAGEHTSDIPRAEAMNPSIKAAKRRKAIRAARLAALGSIALLAGLVFALDFPPAKP